MGDVQYKNITTKSYKMTHSLQLISHSNFSMVVFINTELPVSNVVNSVHLLIQSPKTCIFWQVQLTASPLEVQPDQTSRPPPHSRNQYKQHETKHDEANKTSYLDKYNCMVKNSKEFYSYHNLRLYLLCHLSASALCTCTSICLLSSRHHKSATK